MLVVDLTASYFCRQLKIGPRENLIVNASCPGWTITDATKSYLEEKGEFGGNKAKKPDEAAVDVLYLATIPSGTLEPNGKLVQYRKVLA